MQACNGLEGATQGRTRLTVCGDHRVDPLQRYLQRFSHNTCLPARAAATAASGERRTAWRSAGYPLQARPTSLSDRISGTPELNRECFSATVACCKLPPVAHRWPGRRAHARARSSRPCNRKTELSSHRYPHLLVSCVRPLRITCGHFTYDPFHRQINHCLISALCCLTPYPLKRTIRVV